jgi:NTE family protein
VLARTRFVWWAGCAVWLVLAALLGGCATPPPGTHALVQIDPQQGYRFTTRPRAEDNSTGLFVVLTFSGGGSRAAALAQGVLEELASVEIE